ncbi:MAG TPA: V-type ATP synthase subunit I [Candidatus Hydrogenedentes bacterium]|nr:V-type ATP synthase subunit I [Candidatus Hydrogenedentota bacterium]
MAIDRMKKVTVVCEKNRTGRVFKRLFDLGVMEVADVTAMHGEADGALRHAQVSTEECDIPLQKIGLALGLVDAFAPEQQSFIKGLAPVPLVVEHGELERTLADFDLEAVFAEARGLDEKHRQNEHTRGEIRAKLEELALFQGVSAPIRDLRSLKRARALFGLFPQAKFAEAAASAEFSALIACEDLPGPPAAKNAPLRKVVAFAAENEPRARELLAAAGFEEIPLPAIEGKAADRIRDLEGDLSVTDEVEMEIRKAAVRLSAHRRALRLLKAFWEGRKRRILAEAKSMHGEWVGVLSGYVRERDLPALNSMLKEEFPGASCEAADPLPDDDVPVSLTETGGAQPFKLLTGMFGLPPYNAFDPSPFMMFNFYIFFGICFSDAAYGIILAISAGYLARKTRDFEGLNNFARLLFWAGISTMCFGFLMGSFFGDLYKASFVPPDNILARFMAAVTVLDPSQKTMPALGVALLLGILNQFFGIGLKMYGAVRAGDITSAVCDGLFWIITLTGFVLVIAANFVPVMPPVLGTVGLVVLGGGAVALVLTQGRDEKSIFAKAGVGVMSLYGIVGSYGLTAFLGDVMSYCRLLALGLTTGILALSFNMIAGMLWDIPWVGPVLTVLVLIFAHIFNFLINVLGAFVHAMRLLFVEWFGRFYEGGSREFAPLGFNSPAAILKKSAAPQA